MRPPARSARGRPNDVHARASGCKGCGPPARRPLWRRAACELKQLALAPASPGESRHVMKQILVGVDGSKECRAALALAVDLAASRKALVRLVCVVAPFDAFSADMIAFPEQAK